LRLQLKRPRARAAALALVSAAPAALLLVLAATRARADDYVSVHGVYYREASTRVVQPVVEISKDLPGGFDVHAHYLLDAITSASVAAGAPGDTIFTEVRNEAGLAVGKNFDRTRVALSYRYSAESDYWSHGVGLLLSQRMWGDTATVTLFGGPSFDKVASRTRTINCPRDASSTDPGCPLRIYKGGISYSQILSPVWHAQLTYDLSYWDGFQASAYRSTTNFGYETVPFQRTRQSVTGRVAYYLPERSAGFQLHYRYYWDSWSINAHMIEGRVYKTLSRNLEARLSYRHYFQTPADFWCDMVGAAQCPPSDYHAADPKLGHVTTKMPEVKLIWDATDLRGVPLLGWFARGTFEVSYARYFQSTSFGNAHVLQAGYTMPY
jgi:hypothetical protein